LQHAKTSDREWRCSGVMRQSSMILSCPACATGISKHLATRQELFLERRFSGLTDAISPSERGLFLYCNEIAVMEVSRDSAYGRELGFLALQGQHIVI
jgi:hypothetical protein